MIKIFYRGNCGSSKRALQWFTNKRISIEKQKIRTISEKDIIRILMLTDQGILGLFKRPKGRISDINKRYSEIEDMNFSQAILYLENNSDLLRTPIILDEKKAMIGYNETSIREFIPREYRKWNDKF